MDNSQFSRRDFGKLALGAVPLAGVLGATELARAEQARPVVKPNSLINGVQIGCIIPYSFGGGFDAMSLLWNIVDIGISGVEMQDSAAMPFVNMDPAPAAAG